MAVSSYKKKMVACADYNISHPVGRFDYTYSGLCTCTFHLCDLLKIIYLMKYSYGRKN